ncbi:MAG: hypothetical protein IPL96_04275 [Holophagaceae bacterium]|nr:hypothetical protein [Holophagaceae bacterium]
MGGRRAPGRRRLRAIDQNRQAIHIPSPLDGEIEKLGVELNGTYIPIGVSGRLGLANQSAQDSNAFSAGAGSVNQRVKAKASGFYRADDWDLVDAEKAGRKQLESVDRKDLPKEMQALSPGSRPGLRGRQGQGTRRTPGEDPEAQRGAGQVCRRPPGGTSPQRGCEDPRRRHGGNPPGTSKAKGFLK